MLEQLHIWQLLISISVAWAENLEVKLPICPRHLEYFPQELPMHCRMPRNIDSESYPGIGDIPEFQTSLPDSQQNLYFRNDKQPSPIPIPVPPFPLEMQASMMQGMPQGMRFPMPGMPLPMPIPLPAGPPHKLPVIVMPFYSPDVHKHSKHQIIHPSKRHPHKKKDRHHSKEADSDSEEDKSSGDKSRSSGSGEGGWWKGNKKKKHHKKYGISRRSNGHHFLRIKKKKPEFLTPILQYVTKDGYVIFEKQISKNEAKDWLGPKDQAQVADLGLRKEDEDVTLKKEVDFLEELEDKADEVDEGDKYAVAKVKVKTTSKDANEPMIWHPSNQKKIKKQKFPKQKSNLRSS